MKALLAIINYQFVLGKENKVPWKVPLDLAFFRKVTLGNNVIMGLKTYLSIGKPLQDRLNIVIARKEETFCEKGIIRTDSLAAALEMEPAKDSFIIGGGEIFRLALKLDLADTLLLTFVDSKVLLPDTFFPTLDLTKWKLDELKSLKDAYSGQDCQFARYLKL